VSGGGVARGVRGFGARKERSSVACRAQPRAARDAARALEAVAAAAAAASASASSAAVFFLGSDFASPSVGQCTVAATGTGALEADAGLPHAGLIGLAGSPSPPSCGQSKGARRE
jgi:hypothetical protein